MVVGLMDRLVPKRTHAPGCDAKAHGLRIRRLIVGCGVQDSRDSFFFLTLRESNPCCTSVYN